AARPRRSSDRVRDQPCAVPVAAHHLVRPDPSGGRWKLYFDVPSSRAAPLGRSPGYSARCVLRRRPPLLLGPPLATGAIRPRLGPTATFATEFHLRTIAHGELSTRLSGHTEVGHTDAGTQERR